MTKRKTETQPMICNQTRFTIPPYEVELPSAYVPSLPLAPEQMAQKVDPKSLTSNGRTIESMQNDIANGLESQKSMLDKVSFAKNFNDRKAAPVANKINSFINQSKK